MSMHCAECCLRLAKNKDGTVPKHYLDDEFSWSGTRQKVCSGSGTRKYREDREVSRCRRWKSDAQCPTCKQRPGLKKDGRFRKHDDGGTECDVSKANR
jgi:hypothetical protein